MDPNVFIIAGQLLVVMIAVAFPILAAVGLLWLAKRQLEGRRGRFDGVLTGVARAGVMSSHLNADTPHPDDIANPARRR